MADPIFGLLSKSGSAIGKGLIAGLAGTIAMTIGQLIEMKITKRSSSDAPAKVAGDVLGVEVKGEAKLERQKAKDVTDRTKKKTINEIEANKEIFSQAVHFGYGTGWGVTRGALELAGVHGLTASLAHFGAVWTTALIMLPAKDVAPPVTE